MKVITVFFLFFLCSCGAKVNKQYIQAETNENDLKTSPIAHNIEEIPFYDFTACRLDNLGLSSSFGSPKNMQDMIKLINTLPKPVTIPCVLQAVNRPIKVNATKSILSVQAAAGDNNPRIFIKLNNLILSVVPAGKGAHLMEFSVTTGINRSLKAELEFPINENLTISDPFIKINTGAKSSCSGCHINELADNSIPGNIAFSSLSLKPEPSKNISLNKLQSEFNLCNSKKDTSYRCQIIISLMANRPIEGFNFPDSMQTYFQSLGF